MCVCVFKKNVKKVLEEEEMEREWKHVLKKGSERCFAGMKKTFLVFYFRP